MFDYNIENLSWDTEDLIEIHGFHNNTSEIHKNITEIWGLTRISPQNIEDLIKYSVTDLAKLNFDFKCTK